MFAWRKGRSSVHFFRLRAIALAISCVASAGWTHDWFGRYKPLMFLSHYGKLFPEWAGLSNCQLRGQVANERLPTAGFFVSQERGVPGRH
jgi:hypothetical protein